MLAGLRPLLAELPRPARGACAVGLALVTALAGGCPSEGSDAGPAEADAGYHGCPAGFPPPSDPCLEDQCGNELGVGQPCTRGGNECGDLPFPTHASLCTADQSDSNLWYCTKPCLDDDDCGEGAVCAIDPDNPGPSGCLPSSCE